MDCKDGLVDVSCFFMFEGSADSEANATKIEIVLLEDEDAESSSSATIGGQFGVCEDKDERWGRWHNNKVWQLTADDEALGYEEEEEEVDSKQRIDDANSKMDEMEDRLFWETCMAVGYP